MALNLLNPINIIDSTDTTKKLTIDVSTITTATTRTLTVPDASGIVVLTTLAQTLTNKTLTLPIIASISNTGTLTLPTSTDTLVGKATTDTLTNKTLSGNIASNFINGGTVTFPTSTDILVGKATTDTLTNKTIDTTTNTIKATGISSGYVLTGDGANNTTWALPSAFSGVLPVANGGTGAATLATTRFLMGNGTSAVSAVPGVTSLFSAGNGNGIYLTGVTTGGAILFSNAATSGFYNFQLGNNYTTSNTFEITPSTAADGTTFSTPVFKIDRTGIANIKTSLQIGAGATLTANGTSLQSTGPLFVLNNASNCGVLDGGTFASARSLGVRTLGGATSFPMVVSAQPGTHGLLIVRLRFQGSDATILSGEGATIVRNSTGNYTITYTASTFADVPAVSVTAGGITAIQTGTVSSGATSSSAVVTCFTTTTGAAVDPVVVHFIAIGQRGA